MVSRLGDWRFVPLGPRLGAGATLSAVLHLTAFVVLGAVAARSGNPRLRQAGPGAGAAVLVEISPVARALVDREATGAQAGGGLAAAGSGPAPVAGRARTVVPPARARTERARPWPVASSLTPSEPPRRQRPRPASSARAAGPGTLAPGVAGAGPATPAAAGAGQGRPADGDGKAEPAPAAPSARAPSTPATPTPAPQVPDPTPAAVDVAGGLDGEAAPLPGVAARPAGKTGPSPRSLYLAQLRDRLRAAWRAREVYQRVDPQGLMQGSVLVTALQVRLHPDGKVASAAVEASSGLVALDQEALATLGRMHPLPPVPPGLLDPQGGFPVRCSFHLDLGLFRFGNALHKAIGEEWRPSQAFARTADHERITVVRLSLAGDGKLEGSAVVSSAGLDFLDARALGTLPIGMRLPAPPPAFRRGPGPAPVYVAYYHLSGEHHVLRPREDMTAD